VHGPHQDHVLAFARTGSDAAAIIVVGRHFAAMTDGGRRWPTGRDWNASVKLDAFESIQDVMLPGRTLASGDVPVAPLFETLPVALLQAVPRRHRP
jgi:(1->4)-alpha-D-glucan 1-alpha-D-glucosylmutase